MMQTTDNGTAVSRLTTLLLATPANVRAELLQTAASFEPSSDIDVELEVGPLRAALAETWEKRFGEVVPVVSLREVLAPPVPIGTVLPFLALNRAATDTVMRDAVTEMLEELHRRIRHQRSSKQLPLFDCEAGDAPVDTPCPAGGDKVAALSELVAAGKQYRTIYADPPWQYTNRASRAAAENHYRTLSVEEICEEPVQNLAADNAHLHLWTTNAFLRDAFTVIDAWGFTFKSCLVWVKDEMGMGNYYRVSHEFLMLGVRGNLTFRDRKVQSWLQARRTAHSRKPPAVRMLVERVSPGPYLELYGREELPGSAWTVYGNQVEPRLF